MHLPSQLVNAVLVTAGLIGLDTLLGWLGALVKGTWDWHKSGQFVAQSVLPYVGGLLALAVLAVLEPSTAPGFYVAAAAADAKLIADVVSKAAGLGGPSEVVTPPTPAPAPAPAPEPPQTSTQG